MNLASSGRRRLKLFLAYTEPEFAGAYQPDMLERLERYVDVVRNHGPDVLTGSALAEAAAGCDLMIAYRSTPCDAQALQAMPQLLAFIRAAVDISTVDVGEATRQGILVTQVTPGFFNAVAELGIGMLVDLARGITRHRLGPHGGQGVVPQQGRELSGSTLGFIGYGGIARRMCALAQAFGMRAVAYDPLLADADIPLLTLDAVLRQSDFVVCLAAANAQTRHLINEQTLTQMKRGSFFINLSRGELVDEDALERALDSGHLGGAALDVGTAADQKPSARFIGRADVVLTQHIGSTTAQARAFQTLDSIEQAVSIAQGRSPHGAVNTEAAHRIRTFMDAHK